MASLNATLMVARIAEKRGWDWHAKEANKIVGLFSLAKSANSGGVGLRYSWPGCQRLWCVPSSGGLQLLARDGTESDWLDGRHAQKVRTHHPVNPGVSADGEFSDFQPSSATIHQLKVCQSQARICTKHFGVISTTSL